MESPIPALMAAVDKGDRSAAEPLFAALYAELHRLAKQELSRQGGAMSVGATTLLHEAYLNMAEGGTTTFPSPRFGQVSRGTGDS